MPIFPVLWPMLRKWRDFQALRGLHHPTTPVLCTATGKGMTEQQAWRKLKRLAQHAGIDPVNPHKLRRTFGSHLINKGVRLEVVSKLLGHSSTTITEKAYAELLDATIAAEVLKAVS